MPIKTQSDNTNDGMDEGLIGSGKDMFGRDIYDNKSGLYIPSFERGAINWSQLSINNAINPPKFMMSDGKRSDLSHAQELAKYGQISWGYNITASASLGAIGGLIELGTLITTKGWARDYKTIYYAPGFASLSASHSFFFVYSMAGKRLPTFSDWNSLSTRHIWLI